MKLCKIVMYHYVRSIKNSKYSQIKGLELDGFEKQINYFKKNFNLINIEELLDIIYENRELTPNSILLTFDDGLKDHYKFVFPILSRNKIQGVFFLPSKPIMDKCVLDVHKIQFILNSVNDQAVLIKKILEFIQTNEKEYELPSSDEFYSKFFTYDNRYDTNEVNFIKKILQRELPKKLRSELTQKFFEEFITNNEETFADELYLSHTEIKEMIEGGMYFGSHSHSHEWLTKLSEEELEEDLKLSTDFISRLNNNQKALVMCYPYGDFNDNVIGRIKKLRYKAAFSTVFEDAYLTKENSFSLQRYDTNDFPQ